MLQDVLDRCAVAYLDDIFIFSQDPHQHDGHVRLLLHRLIENRLYCKLEKCSFSQTRVAFLGFVLSDQGLEMSPRKGDAVLRWPSPVSVKSVQRFLASTHFYCKFIHLYSQHIVAITLLLKKGCPFLWDKQAEAAFTALKGAFSAAVS